MKNVTILFFLLFSKIALGQTALFEDVVNYYGTHKNFNGVVAVATNGKLDYLDTFGIADRAVGTPINTNSKFRIASLTKTFTAVMIMQLFEQGKIDLNATIGTYLPTFLGEAKDKVTIRHLITYSSGIPNQATNQSMDVYQQKLSADAFIVKYCSGNLTFEPGTQSVYNNGDYILLGKIIEQVTNKTFEQQLKKEILEPLAMQETNMHTSQDTVNGLVSTYTYNDSTQTFDNDQPYYIETYGTAGAMYATAQDLVKFDQGIFGNKILNAETLEIMLAPNADLGGVAFGFWVSDGYGALDTKFVYRPGGILGATANWIHLMDRNQTFILLSNTDTSNLFEITEQLVLASKGQKTTLPTEGNQK